MFNWMDVLEILVIVTCHPPCYRIIPYSSLPRQDCLATQSRPRVCKPLPSPNVQQLQVPLVVQVPESADPSLSVSASGWPAYNSGVQQLRHRIDTLYDWLSK